MKLKKLLKDLDLVVKSGSKEIEITAMTNNSKLVGPGHLFIAKKGTKHDGVTFIPDAIAAGAVAILTDLYNPFLGQITQIVTNNVVDMETALAKRFYEDPSNSLYTMGVTGTCGKTSTTFFLKHLLDEISETGLIGTIETIIGDIRFESTLTTPDTISIQKILKDMVNIGLKQSVIEISSHALSQKRVQGVSLDLAIFLNLTKEHLDYHETMENYFSEKKKIFDLLKPKGAAIISGECPYGRKLLSEIYRNNQKNWEFDKEGPQNFCSERRAIAQGQGASENENSEANQAESKTDSSDCFGIKATSFGFQSSCDIFADSIEHSLEGSVFTLHTPKGVERVKIPHFGYYNILNALAAVAGALQLGMELSQIALRLETLPQISGRMEKVENEKGINIYIDFAHKEDALEQVLKSLRWVSPNKLTVVFGCGGNRDREKRPKMAKVSETHSDYVIVTSDNPRRENPMSIAQEITSGFTKDNHKIILDRKEAIMHAIENSKPGDTVLIAGRGHERSQIFENQIYAFHDTQVAKEIVNLV